MLLLWTIFVICVSCLSCFLSVHCSLVVTCWETGPKALLCVMFYCVFVTFPCGVPRGGGGTLIFSYIRRLGPFFLVQIFEFQYFFGFSEK